MCGIAAGHRQRQHRNGDDGDGDGVWWMTLAMKCCCCLLPVPTHPFADQLMGDHNKCISKRFNGQLDHLYWYGQIHPSHIYRRIDVDTIRTTNNKLTDDCIYLKYRKHFAKKYYFGFITRFQSPIQNGNWEEWRNRWSERRIVVRRSKLKRRIEQQNRHRTRPIDQRIHNQSNNTFNKYTKSRLRSIYKVLKF